MAIEVHYLNWAGGGEGEEEVGCTICCFCQIPQSRCEGAYVCTKLFCILFLFSFLFYLPGEKERRRKPPPPFPQSVHQRWLGSEESALMARHWLGEGLRKGRLVCEGYGLRKWLGDGFGWPILNVQWLGEGIPQVISHQEVRNTSRTKIWFEDAQVHGLR